MHSILCPARVLCVSLCTCMDFMLLRKQKWFAWLCIWNKRRVKCCELLKRHFEQSCTNYSSGIDKRDPLDWVLSSKYGFQFQNKSPHFDISSFNDGIDGIQPAFPFSFCKAYPMTWNGTFDRNSQFAICSNKFRSIHIKICVFIFEHNFFLLSLSLRILWQNV